MVNFKELEEEGYFITIDKRSFKFWKWWEY